jgi:predicted AAA+ superfamily ATPase
MAVVELTPFLWGELPPAKRRSLWLLGGYPAGGVLHPGSFPEWQVHYLELLAARDLPNWGLPAQPRMTQRLLKMLAGLNGQTLNASQIGRSLGISYKTVNAYLDFIEGAFLVRRLLPYHANLGKRLIKSPKIFWRDTGLLHALMNVDSEEALFNQPWVGAAWEGFVIEQIIGHLKLANQNFDAYFLRTSDQQEIDLVLDFGKSTWAVEIKLTASVSTRDIEKLSKTADLINADRRILLSRTARNHSSGKHISCNLRYLLEMIMS